MASWLFWTLSSIDVGHATQRSSTMLYVSASSCPLIDDSPPNKNKKSRTNNKRVPAIFQEITQLLTSFVVSLLQPVPIIFTFFFVCVEPTTLARPKGSSFTTKGEHSGLKWASANGHWPYTGHHNVNANRGWWLKLLNMQVARKSIRHLAQ